MTDLPTLDRMIRFLRETHEIIPIIFTRGGCYEFARALQTLRPDGELIYAWLEGHVYLKIEDKYVDIDGVHDQPKQGLEMVAPMYESSVHPSTWKVEAVPSILNYLAQTSPIFEPARRRMAS